jgi:hypothetical protein
MELIVRSLLTKSALELRGQTTFVACFGGEFSVPGKATRLGTDRAAAFPACIGRERAVLREAAFLVRHVGAAFASDFALFFLIHASEATSCQSVPKGTGIAIMAASACSGPGKARAVPCNFWLATTTFTMRRRSRSCRKSCRAAGSHCDPDFLRGRLPVRVSFSHSHRSRVHDRFCVGFSDAEMLGSPHALTVGVGEAPRHEVARG